MGLVSGALTWLCGMAVLLAGHGAGHRTVGCILCGLGTVIFILFLFEDDGPDGRNHPSQDSHWFGLRG